MDTSRVHPEMLAGDPFAAAGGDQDHPHACMGAYVYLGHTAYDPEVGDEVEVVDAVPCRRCNVTVDISCGEHREEEAPGRILARS